MLARWFVLVSPCYMHTWIEVGVRGLRGYCLVPIIPRMNFRNVRVPFVLFCLVLLQRFSPQQRYAFWRDIIDKSYYRRHWRLKLLVCFVLRFILWQ